LDTSLLEVLLNSWDRNNTILVNLLRAIPEGGLEVRAMEGSPSVAELFTHIHYVRLVFVSEDAPEFAGKVPEKEWAPESDRNRMAGMLKESARTVRDAVMGRIQAGREMDLHYDHPILFLQHMIWHEGYHHGQIKLALKMAGRAIGNKEIGPLTWRVWMQKRVDSANVVTGFEFPHGRIVRGPRESFTAETSLPVTIFASSRNFCHRLPESLG
jgi:uncharacterized damage-inducible protein DinB